MVTKNKFNTVHFKGHSSTITVKLKYALEVDNTKEGKRKVANYAFSQIRDEVTDIITGSKKDMVFIVE